MGRPVSLDSFVRRLPPGKFRGADKQRNITRQRVCATCVTPQDFYIGGVHSEKPCMRCGATPCVGAIVDTVMLAPASPKKTPKSAPPPAPEVVKPEAPTEPVEEEVA